MAAMAAAATVRHAVRLVEVARVTVAASVAKRVAARADGVVAVEREIIIVEASAIAQLMWTTQAEQAEEVLQLN